MEKKRFLNHFYSIVLLTLFTALPNLGSAAPLSSFEEFSTLSANWQFESKFKIKDEYYDQQNQLQQNIQAKSIIFIKRTIYNGLKKIEDLNPWLAELAAMRMTERPIEFASPLECGANCGAIHFPYKYYFFKWKFGPSLIGISPDLSKVLLRAIGMDSYVELDIEEMMETPQSYFESAIFHEMLHRARLDNRSLNDHNSVKGIFEHEVEQDLVYACSSQAYRGGTLFEKYLEKMPNGKMKIEQFTNTRLACTFCAGATLRDNKWVSDPSLVSADAARRCDTIPPEGVSSGILYPH